MVGLGFFLLALAAWQGWWWWFHRPLLVTPWFLVPSALSGVAAVAAMEAGWVVTEVGRQPWIVYRVLLVSDAVTPSSGVPVTLGVILALYAILTVVSIGVPMIMSRRWRQETPAEEEAEQVPYGPSPAGASPAWGSVHRLPCPGHPLARREALDEPLTGGHRGRRDPVRGHRRVRAVRRGGLRRRDLGPAVRRRRARRGPPGAHRRVHHPGLGRQPRVAGLRPGAAVDRVPARVRRHLHRAVRPARPVPAGIVLRGAGFAFRHTAQRLHMRSSPARCSPPPR